MTRSSLLSPALLAATLVAPSYARADVPPPPDPPNPCDGKQAGDACGGGVCEAAECCKRRHVSATIQHYESQKPLHEQDPDIVDPPTVCKPCLKCAAPAAAAPTPSEAAKPSKRDTMCSVVPRSSDAGAAGLLLALLFFTRRRAR